MSLPKPSGGKSMIVWWIELKLNILLILPYGVIVWVTQDLRCRDVPIVSGNARVELRHAEQASCLCSISVGSCLAH